MALRVRLRDLLAEVKTTFALAFHRHDVADVYGQTLTLGDEKTLTPGIQFCDLNYPPGALLSYNGDGTVPGTLTWPGGLEVVGTISGDGSGLTGIAAAQVGAAAATHAHSAGDITSGVLAATRGGAGNVDGILMADGAGNVSAAVDGADYLSSVTGALKTHSHSATDITSGVLAAALGGAGTVNGVLKANGSGAVSAAAASDINTALGAGGLADAALSSNIPRLNAANTFTAANTVTRASNDQTVALSVKHTASTVEDGSANTGADYTMGTTWLAVKFTATSTTSISSFALRLKSSATFANPTATLTGYIYSDSAGVPGSALATWSELRYGSLQTSWQVLQFGSSAPLSVTAGTSYWLVVNQSSAPGGGSILFDSAATGTARIATSSGGTSWATADGTTLWYQVYGRTGHAVSGTSTNSFGVYGTSTNSVGVYGYSANNSGVYGTSTNSFGVYGTSTNNSGACGTSTNSFGVYGYSANSFGVYGYSANSAGVSGTSTNSFGVYGTSTNSVGVYARQSGTLTGTLANATLYVTRTPSAGSYTISSDLIYGNDAPTGTPTRTGNLLRLQKDSSDRFTVNLDGLTGIGNVTPTYALHVAPSSGVTAGQTVFVRDATPSTGQTAVVLKAGAADTAASGLLKFQNSSGTVGVSIPYALRDAADDAAAAALSPAVPVGGLYRTGSVVKIRVS